MTDKLSFSRKVFEFLMKKGFYIALFICLVIVGATGFIITKRNIDYYSSSGGIIDDDPAIEDVAVNNQTELEELENYETNEVANDGPDKIQEPQQKPDNSESKAIVVNEPEDNEKAKQTNNKKQNDKQVGEATKPKKQEFIYPVQGEIIMDYAMDKLAYSKTLEQWIVHKGIDIKGLRGSPVKACSDGVVEKIYQDPKLGITIVINHGDGLKSKYSNLSIDSMVKQGQRVTQGDVISGVGDTAIFEIGDEPHLHFEVLKNDKNVDPKTYLPN